MALSSMLHACKPSLLQPGSTRRSSPRGMFFSRHAVVHYRFSCLFLCLHVRSCMHSMTCLFNLMLSGIIRCHDLIPHVILFAGKPCSRCCLHVGSLVVLCFLVCSLPRVYVCSTFSWTKSSSSTSWKILKLLCVFVQDNRLNCACFSICQAHSCRPQWNSISN